MSSVERAEAHMRADLLVELLSAMAGEFGGPTTSRTGAPMTAYTTDRPGLRLAPDTLDRLRGLFAGHSCCRCGAAAERLSGDRFYCMAHFPRAARAAAAAPPRVYRCPAGLER